MILRDRTRELLRLEGVLFIEEAYRQLLNRECNASGLEHHLTLLEKGMAKQTIVISFLLSEEAGKRFAP